MLSVLVVEDETALASLWEAELGALGSQASVASTLVDARSILAQAEFDLILLDVNLPDGSGLDLLQELSNARNRADVVITTAHVDVNVAVRALRLGARDLLTKPCRLVELEQHIARVARQRSSPLRRGADAVVGPPVSDPADHGATLVGESEAIVAVRRSIARVAPMRTAVLIRGETGTGKHVAARMIHAQGGRADPAFVTVNCAALPPRQAEVELFGDHGSAFVDADHGRDGVVRAAAGRTLFLDEVGDLPLELQGKLLRLLERGEAKRFSGGEADQTAVRVVASTHQDLRRLVDSGKFRDDLYYRLAAFELQLPPLRHILDDLPAIALHHLEALAAAAGSPVRTLSREALEAMSRYNWPGNVRELRNVIEGASILADDMEIPASGLSIVSKSAALGTSSVPRNPDDTGAVMKLADMEWTLVRRALAAHKGNKTAAARALGISLRTLYNKLESRAHEFAVERAA